MTQKEIKKAKVLLDAAAIKAEVLLDKAATKSEGIVKRATDTARELESNREDMISKVMTKALKDVFDTGKASGRFVDVSRIPLLCKAVIEIRADMSEIKESQVGLQEAIQTVNRKDSDHYIEEEKKRKFWDKIKWKMIESAITAGIVIGILILTRTGIINLK